MTSATGSVGVGVSRSFSIYLDLVRFTAAFLVFISHSNRRLISETIIPASSYGHSAVIIFFVLSGFVIAYVTSTKERDLASYVTARFSRVYSVAIPAILITLIADAIGRHLYLDLYDSPWDQFVVRTVASLAMLNEVWQISITSFSNVPYWSICYEVWYYVAFGLFAFLPRRWGLIGVAAVALLLGPKVVLLAPLWIAGVVVYRWRVLRGISIGTAWVLTAVSLLGIVAFHALGVKEFFSGLLKAGIGARLHTELAFSKDFIGDYILGLFVCMNFVGMRRLCEAVTAPFYRFERPIRFCAGYTFSLYLMHQPLILFWAAVIQGDPGGPLYWTEVMILTLATVLIVGSVTEHKRYLLSGLMVRCLGRLNLGQLR